MSDDPLISVLQEWLEVSMRHSMRQFLRHARESGLSMSHFGAIFHLKRSGSCGVTEVGEHLGVTSAAASQMLDRLVGLGLVERTEDPDDRRVKRIELTEQGQQVFEQGLRARQSWLEDLEAILTAEEKQSLISALNLLVAKVRQLPQGVHTPL
jgi:DNA-binding MarR family transcriptional regulator